MIARLWMRAAVGMRAALGLALCCALAQTPRGRHDRFYPPCRRCTRTAQVGVGRGADQSTGANQRQDRAACRTAPRAALSPLTEAKIYTGMHAGLDEEGTLALALFPAEDPAAAPEWAILLPVTDYPKFLAQLQPDDADKPVARVRVLGHSLRICRQVCRGGELAVLAAEDTNLAR